MADLSKLPRPALTKDEILPMQPNSSMSFSKAPPRQKEEEKQSTLASSLPLLFNQSTIYQEAGVKTIPNVLPSVQKPNTPVKPSPEVEQLVKES